MFNLEEVMVKVEMMVVVVCLMLVVVEVCLMLVVVDGTNFQYMKTYIVTHLLVQR